MVNIKTNISTYSEKALHRKLKWWIDPTGEFHETQVGNFIADIKTEAGITEIQTQSFYKLNKKLDAFLPEHKVTIVCPLTYEKQIIWVDKTSGDILRKRRSPKRESFYSVFWELYQIKRHLVSSNLRLRLMLINLSEWRVEREGIKRKKYKNIDTTIHSVYDELIIDNADDYMQLIPATLLEPFTTRDYTIAANVNKRVAGSALNVLLHVGAVKRIGKSGNAYLYVRCPRQAIMKPGCRANP